MAFEGIRNMLEVAHGKHCACGFCGEANAELAAVEELLEAADKFLVKLVDMEYRLPIYEALRLERAIDLLKLSPQGDGPKEPRT